MFTVLSQLKLFEVRQCRPMLFVLTGAKTRGKLINFKEFKLS